jgi:hypothetical protein
VLTNFQNAALIYPQNFKALPIHAKLRKNAACCKVAIHALLQKTQHAVKSQFMHYYRKRHHPQIRSSCIITENATIRKFAVHA